MSDSKTKYIMAIDHGTSGVKTAIVSTTGNVIDWHFEEVSLHILEGGGAEQDPDDWWSAFLKGAKKVIAKANIPVDDIVGICYTSQWSGTVAIDEQGNHLINCIIWMDTRGAPYVEKYHKSILQFDGMSIRKSLKSVKINGGAPTLSGKDPIAHILWIKDKLPEIYNKTYKFLEPQDYMNLKLTGKIAASYASIQNHWLTDIRDINNIKYSKKLIKWAKIKLDKLPEDLKLSTDVLGPITKELASALGLNPETKVIMGAPDLFSATIGSGSIKDFEGYFCIGTSDWLLCHFPKKKTDAFHNMTTSPAAIPGKYMLLNEQEIAGGALSFLRDNILYHKDELMQEAEVPDIYKVFDKIVEKTPAGSHKVIFTPWLYGERSPIDDHTIRGGIYNISLGMNREHLIRAIFEGVAYNVKWLLMYVEKFIKKEMIKQHPEMKKADKFMPELAIIGGGAQSNIWCQIFADVLDRKIKQVKDPIQANARGAAFIASVGLGYIDWDDIPKYIEYSNIFEPNPENREIYDELFY